MPAGVPEQPEEFRAAIERAEMIGAVLYQVDQVAAKATDAVLAVGSREELASKTQGWIVSHTNSGSWIVRFATEEPNGIFAHIDVPFEGETAGASVFHDPPVQLIGLEEERFRARLTAVNAAAAVVTHGLTPTPIVRGLER